eukprot:CAMPEP_0202787362 /NCGR_PEP_ID=MMETSP1388-20130828/72255_1 /ASSEMBLY_ACC=CAM_ASM_000864 /TAXON_ID=37098 /ORGANISM="Isochrysis sp, Strain CCMP1244" /LENGTH=50 /DNA_ID=CAMNT_0049456949 /DNA_START=55 /DNA_END=204 /DNA_ORIENTATION=-
MPPRGRSTLVVRPLRVSGVPPQDLSRAGKPLVRAGLRTAAAAPAAAAAAA